MRFAVPVLASIGNRTIRAAEVLETERFELPKYGLSHPSYAAGLVDIIDSNQPGPVTVQCISKTADSRDQRTKVKGPCW